MFSRPELIFRVGNKLPTLLGYLNDQSCLGVDFVISLYVFSSEAMFSL